MSHIDLRARPGLRAGQGRWLVPPWTAPVLLACAVLLIPWTTLLFATLPRHYTANHWPIAWGRIRHRPRCSARLDGRHGRAAFAVCRGDGNDHGDAPLLRRVVRHSHLAGRVRHRSGSRFRRLRGASAGRVVLLDGPEPCARGRSCAAISASGRFHDQGQPAGSASAIDQ
jgi:hypothetical protein